MAKNIIEKGRHGKDMRKKERRVRETGGFYVTGEGEGSNMCPQASPSSPSKSTYYYYCFNHDVEKEEKKVERRKKKKKKLLSNSHGIISSSSSVNGDDGFEFFTSEDQGECKEEETETFFSSRSFSSDSSEFYQQRRPMPNAKKKKKKKNKKASRCPPRRRSKNHENQNAREGFRPLIYSIASRKKVKESEEEKRGFAVVKRSSDPYGDFRSSIVEMIIGRQIFEAEDLERLLHSYLSLNSPHHHPIILQAFSDIYMGSPLR